MELSSIQAVHWTRMRRPVLRLLVLLLLLFQLLQLAELKGKRGKRGLRECLSKNKNQLKNRQRCFKKGKKKEARSFEGFGHKKKKGAANKIGEHVKMNERFDKHNQRKLRKGLKNQRKGRRQDILQRKKEAKCPPRTRRARTGHKRQVQSSNRI